MEPESIVVALEGVVKAFGQRTVLDGVDLRVHAKETLVILGPSGTGKSITIRHVVGLEKPDRGRVLVFGKDLATASRRELDGIRRRIGYLFQSGALINWMTIAENVELPLLENPKEVSKRERRRRVEEKLEMVGLTAAAGRYPSEISGGMKKRAALARALMLDPEVILYDEPTTGLDPVIANTINELILETARRTGSAQIVVTHDLASAWRLGDRIALLHAGRIVAEGTPDELRGSADPTVRQFISGSTEGPLTSGGTGTGSGSGRLLR